jgi:hypothetical protein
MRPIEKHAPTFAILLLVVLNPTDAQAQASASQPQIIHRQQLSPAAKARFSKRFHQLNYQYGALKNETAKYAYATAIHPALRQTQSEIISTKREIDNLQRHIKNELDSMSELGEMEALRLQMAMDRLSKLMSTLSNLLKKASETSAGITENIK